MKPLEYYRGREQTYLKHFFLERYLERVAYNIGSFTTEFVYVDGFSGPWQSADQTLEDTSFMIAVQKLRQVRTGLARRNRPFRIRRLFIEKETDAFERLHRATRDITDFEAIRTLNGEFEQLIPEILRFIGPAFSLVFIDPTGWTGFGLKRIAPLLLHRPGEVLVNFMFDHINRFLSDQRPETAASFAELLGGPGWENAVGEDAKVELYRERMRAIGNFPHVTSTRILKPLSDRSYFYLIYATRSPKGLVEFRSVEKRAVEEQERVRLVAKQSSRISRTGQNELFPANTLQGPPGFEQEQKTRLKDARERLRRLLVEKKRVRYEDAQAALLETPLVWESHLKSWIMEMYSAKEISIEGMRSNERTPKKGHVLVLTRIG